MSVSTESVSTDLASTGSESPSAGSGAVRTSSSPAIAEHSHGAGVIPPDTRAAIIRSADVADFPVIGGREEEWRFTPIRRLRGLTNGQYTKADRGLRHEFDAPAGATVSRLPRAEAPFGKVLTPFDRPSAEAFSGAEQALMVSVAADAVVTEPVMVRVVGEQTSAAAGVTFDHTVIEVGVNAQVTIVLDQRGSATVADNVEIDLAEGANVRLVSIADWDRDTVQLQHHNARLAKDASLTHIAVTLGGDVVRQYTSIDFAGPGASVDAYGIYFADAGQHFEHRLLVDHHIPDCRSNVVYRGALQGAEAHTVWVGDVLIRAAATGTETYEVNRNLVLTDGARADSVPNLEIETGEIVSAGHAAATGRFDDEQLFYLQSRGIPEDEARRLVVRAFFAELLDKIGLPDVSDRLTDAVEARLAAAPASVVGA